MDPQDTTSSPWTRIARTVARYPSPHNTQPLHLRLDGPHEATVLFDRACALPAHPLGLRFGHLTLGVWLGAVDVAAHALGLRVEVDLLPGAVRPLGAGDRDAETLQPLARLRLDEAGARVPDLDVDLLARRCTSRLPYDGRDLGQDVLVELVAEARAHGHRFGSTDSRHHVAHVVDLNQRTLFDDLARPAVREELRAWMRFSDRDAARRGDGFSPACLHTPGWLLRAAFTRPRLFASAPVQALARRSYLRSMRGTPRVAWVRGPLGTPGEAVVAGRLMIRLWLRLTAHGVAVHPFGSVVTDDASLADLEQTVATSTGAGPGPEGTQTWMVLRLGYSAVPPQSLRRPLHAQLHTGDLVDEGVR